MAPSSSQAPSGLRRGDVLLVLTLIGFLALLAGREGGASFAWLAIIGAVAGIALYHAGFGFTAAWRRFILERKSVGLRAQLILLALGALFFFPLLGMGEAFGHPLGGFVFPVGVALITGAFLFGIGMQLGGGCGSGTLFTMGGGSVRMLVTLAFFVIGSTLATATGESWLNWPKLPAQSLISSFGALHGYAILLAILIGLYVWVRRAERLRYGTLVSVLSPKTRWLTGPWSLAAGAIVLVGVNVAVLLTTGWPWGITAAFALWGAKAAQAIGLTPGQWLYWQGQEASLAAPVLADPTSVINFGIILGAMAAAMLAKTFNPSLRIPGRSLAAAVLGGLLLGIGARLGTGCNIGALFSGVISGSLHGWIWLIFAFAGNMLGVRLRPLFRLD